MEEPAKRGDSIPAALMFKFINDQGFTQVDFAKRIDQSPQTLTNWKTRGIPWSEIVPITQAMGISVEEYLDTVSGKRKHPASYGLPNRRTSPTLAEPRPGAVVIPMLAAEGAQGYGRAAPDPDVVIGGLQVTRKWAATHLPDVSSYNQLRLITAIGDSNAPTIQPGAIVMVDLGKQELKTDAFFVFGRGDEILIKKVHRMLDGGIVIKGASVDAIPERLEPKQTPRVIGRVVYVWNGRDV